MTQKRITVADTTPVRVVLVTMDSHLSGAAMRAANTLKKEIPGLQLLIHAADEWGSDDAALTQCRHDIAIADIVVAAMLFLDEHVRAVLPDLEARRAKCDALVCCMSAGEAVRLTRMGKLDMSSQAKGAMSWLKSLRGKKTGNGSSGKGQMKLLRQLPKILRFIPGAAQDLRAYFLVMQYWLNGSDENIANLICLLVQRYAAGPRATLTGNIKVQAPLNYPDVGLYHPRAKQRILDSLRDLPAPSRPAIANVGVLILRSYVLAGNAGHYDSVIEALEARGLRPIVAFSAGLDQRPAIEKFFMPDGTCTVDAVVSLTGFSLVGGPAYNDAHAAEDILTRLDVPYLAAHPVEFQTLEQWQQDKRGLTPVEATMMVAIPELDGAISPMTFGGRSSTAKGGPRDMTAEPERAAMLAARVARLVTLRRTARAERKLAVVLFNFPPNAGATGTAAYLSVFASLFNTLKALQQAGYKVEVPASIEALRQRILGGNAARYGMEANVAARIGADDHVRRERWLPEIEKQWGPAPGRQNSDGRQLMVLGEHFGNVFVGIQPGFGYEGDPMRLLFEGGFSPTHAFSAFYRWLREDFGAHAVLHFGTHGALEFMPGKQTGLSAACWPDRLIGDLPNFYLYASNNPSEGTLAKRRGGATLISYMTPPVTEAGLYRGLIDLKSTIDRWRSLEPEAEPMQRDSIASLIQAQAAVIELAAIEPAWTDVAAEIERLRLAVHELEITLIPNGLHIVGQPPNVNERAALLDAAGIVDDAERSRLDALMATDHETPAIIHVLDGGYLPPAPGGDLLRNSDVLPTGRNLHGFDPFRIPSAMALRDGAMQADKLLARYSADTGSLPETMALVLWGTDNLKTEGGPIGQALWLMGAEPRHDSYGRLAGAQLIPLETLGRPRIDVMITLSGIFRDLLPLQIKLLAEAALLAATADEAPEWNFVRKHALALQAAHGVDIATAAMRVYGNTDGAYGANVNNLVSQGGWESEDQLADAFIRRKGFGYGIDGRPVRHDDVLKSMLASVDAAYQNIDSIELGVTTVDHYFDSLGGISRAVQQARGEIAKVYIGDQTQGSAVVRSLSEQVALETRTRSLNPKWYEPMLAHGYEGVRQIEAQVTNTLGWSATTGDVAPWVYQQLTQTFILDPAMRERLAELNPIASAKMANRLLEAHDRNYWRPDQAMLDALRRAENELEDHLEGIGKGVAA